MSDNSFELNEMTLSVIDEFGGHMPGGFFIYRAGGNEELIYANRSVFSIFGCKDLDEFKELTSYTFRGMVHPEDYKRINSSIHDQIENSIDHMDYAEYRIIRKDKAIRWVDDYGHYLNTSTYGGVFTVFISDITEKHEQIESNIASQMATIEALNETLKKVHVEHITFSKVAQALAGDYFSIYVVDPETDNFVRYSAAKEYDRLGLQKSGEDFFNMMRMNMENLIHQDDRVRFMNIFTKEKVFSILKRDGSFTTKFRLLMEQGPTYVSMKATLLVDEDGSHLIIGTNNIDAQMKREQEFQQKMSDARNKAKNDFLANMSHDIRTPMNAIVGYTNIANANLDDHELVRDSLAKIGSSSHFLLSLINDVLDMSKIENGMMQLSESPCDLFKIFKRIEDITSLQAKNKNLNTQYNKENIVHAHVLADELRIEQILINIVNNAIKYTPEGKDVQLKAEELGPADEGKIRYRFTISDTGIGISEDYLPYIFDSFTREQNTTINRIQGTGLGLAITARVVEQMGGKIEVESRINEGSTFTVTLDLMPTIPEQLNDEETQELNIRGHKVLLVEDNDINAEIAMMMLKQSGIEVDRAENGQSGLERVKENHYAAVLMDIQMPIMNGYETSRAIRQLDGEYFKKLPIIAISANAYDDDVKQCLEAGMNDHIAKPFNPDDLMKLLHKYINE
ncbi:MAG: response regulator [Erysipelotrichaceae bacterium]|nr:response regulator [Erysipelotrichaceae bacterium]